MKCESKFRLSATAKIMSDKTALEENGESERIFLFRGIMGQAKHLDTLAAIAYNARVVKGVRAE